MNTAMVVVFVSSSVLSKSKSSANKENKQSILNVISCLQISLRILQEWHIKSHITT